MNIEQFFDKSIASYFGHQKAKKGDIGLEIEVEGLDLPNVNESHTIWKSVPEGSLRNGMEYVLKNPVNVDRIPDVLETWSALVKGATLIPSIRTSVHVHVNVSSLMYSEYLRAMALYWLVESLLVGLNGETREGNLFCLRVRDADNVASMVIDHTTDLVVLSPHPDSYKYSALNIAALSRYMSMEFRFVRGTTHPKIMQFWCENLYNFVHRSREIKDLTPILSSINLSDVRPFLAKVLPAPLCAAVFKKYTLQEMNSSVGLGYNYAVKLDAVLKTEVRPKSYTFNKASEDLVDPLTHHVFAA